MHNNKKLVKSSRLHSESVRATVMSDDATVRWKSDPASAIQLSDDQLCVRTSLPISKDVAHFVFEVKILGDDVGGDEDEGREPETREITIGIAAFEESGRRKSSESYTYCSKTGQVKGPSQASSTKHSQFRPGDTVACGVSFHGNSVDPFVFFARNGQMLEPFLPWRSPSLPIFPFVSSSTPGTAVRIVLPEDLATSEGWDLTLRSIQQDREEQQQRRIWGKTPSSDSGKVEDLEGEAAQQSPWERMDGMCEKVVRDFLYHHGYVETLRAMDDETEEEDEDIAMTTDGTHVVATDDDDVELQFARERRKVRGLVLEGNAMEAKRIVQERWPTLMDTNVGLELRIQCLVELILAGRYTEAVQHARTQLWQYLTPTVEGEMAAKMATQALGLFALPDPRAATGVAVGSAKCALFAPERRRVVADMLNRALLFHPNPPKSPALDKILMRLAECAAIAREKAGGYGAPFQYE